jgi:hypothetical protein
MYFYVVPALFGPKKAIDPNAEPLNWTIFFVKMSFGLLGLFVLMIIMLYFRQESMLFHPA